MSSAAADAKDLGLVLSGPASALLSNANDGAFRQPSVARSPLRGLLEVTLLEARGLSLPQEYQPLLEWQRAYEAGRAPRETKSSGQTLSSPVPSPSSGSSTGRPQSSLARDLHAMLDELMPYAVLDFDRAQADIKPDSGTPESPRWTGAGFPHTARFDMTRITELKVYLFIRNPNTEPTASTRANDIPLGFVQITPEFEANGSGDANLEGVSRLTSIGWVDVQQGTGQLRIEAHYTDKHADELRISNFSLVRLMGRDSSDPVVQGIKKNTGRVYALKKIRKDWLVGKSTVAQTLAEQSVLAQVNHPFIVPLKFCLEDSLYIYLVLPFVYGKPLSQYPFDVNWTRFYSAELLCALECLHGFDVVCRDLNADSLLLDYQGHLALCHFGLCQFEMTSQDRPAPWGHNDEYLAPEVLLGQSYNKTADWWTLGILLYLMLTGAVPFYHMDTPEMIRLMLSQPLRFPTKAMLSPAAKDLISGLLKVKPAERLGANGPGEIKSHPFFSGIDWSKLHRREYEPPFRHFQTREPLQPTCNFPGAVNELIPPGMPILPSRLRQRQFEGFSFMYERPDRDDAV